MKPRLLLTPLALVAAVLLAGCAGSEFATVSGPVPNRPISSDGATSTRKLMVPSY